MPALTDDAWTQIRYDYEHTSRPVADICTEHGISDGTLRDRVRRWRWTRRRAPIPREGPPALSDFSLPPCGGGSGRGVAVSDETPRHTTTTPTPDPSPQGGGEQPEPMALRHATTSVAPSDAPGLGSPPLEKGRESAAAGEALTAADPAAIAPRLQSAVARVLPAIETIIARLAAGPLPPRETEQTARALGTLTRTLRELNALLAQHPLRAAEPYDDMPEDLDAFRNELARRIEAFVASRGDERFEDAPSETPAGKHGEGGAAAICS